MNDNSKQLKRVMRILDKHGFRVPNHCQGIISNVVSAAEILTEKQIVEMLEDYGF